MSNIQQIEDSIAQSSKVIAKRDALLRLYENADFKEIILEEYLREQAIRMTYLYGSGALQAEAKAEIERDLHAVGAFRQFLKAIVTNGNEAVSDKESAEWQLEEYRAMTREQQQEEDHIVDARDLGV